MRSALKYGKAMFMGAITVTAFIAEAVFRSTPKMVGVPSEDEYPLFT